MTVTTHPALDLGKDLRCARGCGQVAAYRSLWGPGHCSPGQAGQDGSQQLKEYTWARHGRCIPTCTVFCFRDKFLPTQTPGPSPTHIASQHVFTPKLMCMLRTSVRAELATSAGKYPVGTSLNQGVHPSWGHRWCQVTSAPTFLFTCA